MIVQRLHAFVPTTTAPPMTWNHGYNTDLGYTYGYYREQSPVWMDLAAAFHGSRPRSLSQERHRYLELGCGQGLNLALFASLFPDVEFLGIDFNPEHIAHATQLGRVAGLGNLRFLEGDFLALARDPAALGMFDHISAHGIVSWIPPEVHAALASLVGACLKPGGLYYTSYNTFPGWYSGAPIQHLLRLWQKREGLPSLAAIDKGRERLQALVEANSVMTQALPGLKGRLERFPSLARNYLVQEYLHDNWLPFWFDEMYAALDPHKLLYLGSATSNEWYLPSMIPEPFKAILAGYQDPVERQVMLDVLVNQSFRRDLWVKGRDPFWLGQQRDWLLAQRFVLLQTPPRPENGDEAKRYVYQTPLGEVTGKPEIYGKFYEALSTGPKTLAELMTASGQPLPGALQVLSLMLNAGHALPFAPCRTPKPAQALNRAIADAASAGAPYNFLAAPAVGGVIQASDTDLMMLSATTKGPNQPAPIAEGLIQRLLGLNKGLKDGNQALTTAEAMRPKALALAETFISQTLPNWRKLGVVAS